MIVELFYWILSMNMIASMVGLVVFLLRSVKAIPRRFIVFLWLAPFVRMSIPVSIGNPLSLVGFLSTYVMRILPFSKDPISMNIVNSISVAESYNPVVISNPITTKLFYISGIIWLVFSCVLIILITVIYIGNMLGIRNAHHLYGNVYESDSVSVPSVYGIIKPKIVFPTEYPRTNVSYVLDHEKNHIKMGDNIWRLIALYIVSIHWFNPFCWMMFKYFLSDMEMACDERTISCYNTEERKNYMNVLLDRIENKLVFVSSLGGSKINERLSNIIRYKHLTLFSTLGFIIFIIVTIIFLSTNAVY